MDATNGTLTASDIALLNNGENGGFGNGAFFWIFALLILAGGGFGGIGGNHYSGPNPASTEDVQNQFNFAALERQNNETVAAIRQAQYDTTSAVKDLAYNNLGEIRDVQTAVAEVAAAQQNSSCNILRSIDGVNYQSAINTASINANTTAQTQKILDAISTNRMADMQNQINQLQLQNAVCGVVRYPTTTAYFAGPTPYNPPFGNI